MGAPMIMYDDGIMQGVTGRCPRCELCGRVVRTRGLGRVGVWCVGCTVGALPFVGMVGEGEFRGALREYREGLGSRAAEFEGLRFDPFDEEVRGALGGLDATLRGCGYVGGDGVGGRLREVAKEGGCALSLLCHNVRSARGPGLELLEAEMRRWGVQWDVVGLTETWLDTESEKGMAVRGYGVVCASRKRKAGGGVALMLRDGLTYRERPDLGTFDEGVFESVFVEIVRGGGRRNDVVGVVYRPPGGDMAGFNAKLAEVLLPLRGTDAYVMGDFNADLIRASTHGPTSDLVGEFASGGFYPLISLPTRLTDTTATLIDNIWTNNVRAKIGSGLVTVRISDHLPVFAFVGGEAVVAGAQGKGQRRRLVNGARIARFAERLGAWSFDEERVLGVEGNVARFRNAFRDMYDETFPWVQDKRRRVDEEKPWLDDVEFKGLVKEKGDLYSRKIRGRLGEGEQERLVEVSREVNGMRRRLKREYFDQRLGEVSGNARATWEVLGEVLKGRRGRGNGAACGYFRTEGGAVTDGDKIAGGFCDFYC